MEFEKMETIRTNSGGTALTAQRGRGKTRGNRGSGKSNGGNSEGRKCFNCGQVGHINAYCDRPGGPKHKPDNSKKESKQSSKPKEKANVAKKTQVNFDSDEESDTAYMARSGPKEGPDTWIIDSGASSHLSKDRDGFSDFREVSGKLIRIGDDSSLSASGVGTISLPTSANGEERAPVHLRNAMHVPGLAFTTSGCYLKSKSGEIILTGVCKDRLYYLSDPKETAALATALVAKSKTEKVDMEIAHRRMGHLNEKAVRELGRGDIAKGLRLKEGELKPCTSCALSKARRNPAPKNSETEVSRVLELVQADLVGPISPQTPGGSN